MKNVKWYLLLAAVALLLMTGCAATDGGDHMANRGGGSMKAAMLDGGGFFEACDPLTPGELIALTPGQEVYYSFTATGPVNFDVHYHTTDGKNYPVKENNITTLQGKFTVEAESIYCCMWKNLQPTPVDLSYEFKVVEE